MLHFSISPIKKNNIDNKLGNYNKPHLFGYRVETFIELISYFIPLEIKKK